MPLEFIEAEQVVQLTLSKRSTVFGLAAIGLVGVSVHASADTITLDTPENFSNGDERPALISSETGSLGAGSWQADPSLGEDEQHLIYVQGGAAGPHQPGGQTSYATQSVNPQLLFPDNPGPQDDVTINDLVSISYDTKTDAPNDWFVDLFLKDDDGSFGGPNFDLTAGNADNSDAPDGFTRHTFDADGGVVFPDGNSGNTFTLEQLKEEFGDEALLFVALGTATNYDNFDGFIDNFQFSYTGMDEEVISRQIDLEPQQQAVPAPAAWPLAFLGFAGIFGLAVRRRQRG